MMPVFFKEVKQPVVIKCEDVIHEYDSLYIVACLHLQNLIDNIHCRSPPVVATARF
jgi:hypothetical protein